MIFLAFLRIFSIIYVIQLKGLKKMTYLWDVETIQTELEDVQKKIDLLPRFVLTKKQRRQITSLHSCKNSLEKLLFILKSDGFEEEESSYQAYQKIVQEKNYPTEKTISSRSFRDFFYQYNNLIPFFYNRLSKQNLKDFLHYDFEEFPLPEISYSSQELTEICHDILKESGNKQVLSSYEKIVFHSPSLLFLQNEDHIIKGQAYHIYGLSFPISSLQKTYIHCIMQNTYYDLCCFLHEIFHAIYACYDSFHNRGNLFFSEMEGQLSERIVEQYWQKKNISSDIIMTSRLNRSCNALISMENLVIGDLLLKTAPFGNFHFSLVNDYLGKKGYPWYIDKSDVSQIFETSYFHKLMFITSYLGGLDFMSAYEKDSEKLLDTLFQLKQDKAPLSQLLKTYPFSFHEENWDKAKKEFDESQAFYQKKIEKNLK